MTYDRELIRNFCIIAHIDHGKSTLADRLLERTGALIPGAHDEQVLDQMELERERGITIKAKAIRLEHAIGGRTHVLNLIDTPGHVDFSYEVSRALAACEGALLVVDASQGIEAQTLANLYLALDHGLAIIPVINKIDLPNADVTKVTSELTTLGFPPDEILHVSAKTGHGIDRVLDAIVDRVPMPQAGPDDRLRALIFDSHYDPYKGVIAYVRVFSGMVREGKPIRVMGAEKTAEVTELGVFVPELKRRGQLYAGEVGFVAAGIKNVKEFRVGDTITSLDDPAAEMLPGYRPAVPMVFSGLYPVDPSQYPLLREALEKLQLNDAALSFEPETSAALGFGFRCGFLGLLHLDIVRERLEREFGLELVTTAPSVRYEVVLNSGERVKVENPADFPAAGDISQIDEPVVRATIIVPSAFVGAVMELCQDRRGQLMGMDYLELEGGQDRVLITYELPLGEIMYDFFAQLKSRTRGYASLDYSPAGYKPADLVKLDILVNKDPVDALSLIVHRERALMRGKKLVERLAQLIPRQMFEVVIQAAIGSRVITRQTVRPLRKDVLAKCYGGDVTRKRKLLEKQREGKKRMKMVGSVEIPQEAFLAVLNDQ